MTPLLVLALLSPELRDVHTVAITSGIVGYLAVLLATVMLYLCWRTSGGQIGWLVLGVAAVAVQGLAMYGMAAIDPGATASHPGWLALTQLLVALGVGALVLVGAHRTLRVDPLVTGVLVGLVFVAVRYAMVIGTPSLALSPGVVDALHVLVLVVDLAITVGLFQLTAAPDWVRVRVACGWGLLSLAHVAMYPATSNDLLGVVTIVANILGASVLLALGTALLRLSVRESREQLRLANHKLEQVEADQRGDAARLHEVRATLAGLSSASQLIHQAHSVNADRRRQIEAMMDSEMSRLLRLLHDQQENTPRAVDLDSIIEPLVLRHQLRGFPVSWHPSGERVVTVGDNAGEVINVLLENAFQHAEGSEARIYTRHVDTVVEVAVSDSGPGVDRSVRSRIFEWGQHSKASSGSGIGLNVAQQLTVELGGYLRLDDSPALGATFVLGLPAEEQL